MNIGIGIILGLLTALLAVFLVTNNNGPFKEQNTNTFDTSGQVTDPNAPLYGINSTPIVTESGESSIANTQIMDSVSTTATTTAIVAIPNTATPVSNDAISTIITNANTSNTTTKTEKIESQPIIIAKTPKAESSVTEATPKVVKPITAPTTNNTATSKIKQKSYTVQTGAFEKMSDATALKNKLAARGQSVSITERKTANGSVFRVRVGNYTSEKEAQAARSRIGGVVLELNK